VPRKDRAFGVHHSSAHKGGSQRRKIKVRKPGKQKIVSSYKSKVSRRRDDE